MQLCASMPFGGQGGLENGPHISGSHSFVGTLPQALFFPRKIAPHLSESSELVGTLPQALFVSQKNGPQIFDMSSG